MHFLFAPPDARTPRTARKVHIRRLYDLLNVCIQRCDLARAARTWSILARCKEVDWRALWSTSVHILAEGVEHEPRQIEFLHLMMLQHPEDREAILRELVLRMIDLGQHKEALDELELYLPSFPYQDNTVLHLYAGLLSLYLAQSVSGDNQFDLSLLRDAQSYFDRAKALDPDNPTAVAFIDKIQRLRGVGAQSSDVSGDESDEDLLSASENPKRKRVRTVTN